MFCEKCGRELTGNSSACPLCGHDAVPQKSDKSQLAYILLAVFLGQLGVHNFYAGRIGVAVTQLLITSLSCGMLGLITWIWAIIDICVYNPEAAPARRGSNILVIILIIAAVLILPVIAGIAIFAGMLIPAINTAREQTQIISCQGNLYEISMALTEFVDETGALPKEDGVTGLNQLATKGVQIPLHFYICPASGTTTGTGQLTQEHCDYIYLGGSGDWKGCPILIERPGIHSRNKVNILYRDGNTEEFILPWNVKNVPELLDFLAEAASQPEVKDFLLKKKAEFSGF